MSELRILLVDDDPSINFLNKIVIERAGIGAEVTEHTDPETALRQLESGELKPHIILLDLNMPMMDGWDFMSSLKEFSEAFHLPKIILLTSSINPSDRNRALSDTHIYAFHSKPLTVDVVREIAS